MRFESLLERNMLGPLGNFFSRGKSLSLKIKIVSPKEGKTLFCLFVFSFQPYYS